MTTIKLTIDGRPISVALGTTILAAARALGLTIPTLCHVEGFEPSASCFLCAVKIGATQSLAVLRHAGGRGHGRDYQFG
jgi:bidirectional [NiFe] hydrogenase diaphorase subunit